MNRLIIVLLLGGVLFTACSQPNDDEQNIPDNEVIEEVINEEIDESPDGLPPSVMIDNIIYINSTIELDIEVSETDYIGRITSLVPLNEWPSEDGQSNLDELENAPYIEYDDGFAVYWYDKWVYFSIKP